MSTEQQKQPLLSQNWKYDYDANYDAINNTLDETSTSIQVTTSQKNDSGTGTIGAVFIVVNAAMGAGLLNMPSAFSNAGGITNAVVIELSFLIFIFVSLIILAYLSHVNSNCTYQEVIETASGKFIGLLSEISIIIYMFGTCIAMLIIVGDQFDKVMEAIFGPLFCHNWYISRAFTMSMFSIIVIFPLCLPKDIGFLKNSSIAGVISTLLVMLTVVIKYATSKHHPTFTPPEDRTWTSAMAAIPAIFFAYQCHVSSVPIYATMKKKTLSNWSIVITCSILLCAFSYTITGICGYLTFGDSVSSDILESYNAKDWLVIVARAAIVIAMLTTYPILHFCGRSAFFTVIAKVFHTNETESRRKKIQHFIFTLIWFSSSLALAILIPNIGVAIAVVGGLAGCFILTFPGLALFNFIVDKNVSQPLTKRSLSLLILSIVLTVGGIFLFGEITTKAIMDDLNPSASDQASCYSTL